MPDARPPVTDDAPPAALTTTDDPHPKGRLAQRGRDVLGALTTLASSRRAAEAEMADRYEKIGRTAEAAHQDTRDQLNAEYRQDLRNAEEEHRATIKALRSEGTDACRRIQVAQRTDRDAIQAKAEENQSEARTKLDEAIWVAETVYEAGEDQPEQQYRTREKVVEASRHDLMNAAQQARTLLGKYRQGSIAEPIVPDPDSARIDDPDETLHASRESVRAQLVGLTRLRVPRLFRGYILPLYIVLIVIAAGVAAAWWRQWQFDQWVLITIGATVVVLIGLSFALYAVARRQSRDAYARFAASVRSGLAACDQALRDAGDERDRLEAEQLEQREREIRAAKERYEPILNEIAKRQGKHLDRIADTYPVRLKDTEQKYRAQIERAESEHATFLAERQREFEEASAANEQRYAKAMAEREAEHAAAFTALDRRWSDGMSQCAADIAAIQSEDTGLFPAWDAPVWNEWDPPTVFAPSVRFGRLHVDRATIEGGIPSDPRLLTSVPPRFELPATLDFPDHCSLLLLTESEARAAAVETLQTTMFRLLTALPPGKVRFTIIDPVSLGRNFAGFMHLADYDESFVTGRIWTDPRHIEQRLADLTEHMETVIQKYLRNEFDTIADYNEYAGEIAEPYRFLVIADFPTNFSGAAAQRLASIISSGARCGVYTLISVDRRQTLPKEITLDDLMRAGTTLEHGPDGYSVRDETLRDWPLTLDTPPEEDFVTEKLHLVGAAAKDATRVEVPFDVVAPSPDELWTGDCTRALRVPLGRCGATKLQYLDLGQGTSQHVLIAGKTGSGKSTLLHVLITNLALWYSPDEVQFYLVDFKKGVEFKTYAKHALPHARAVAVESDREFGLSVLQRIDAELRRRGEVFRDLGVQDLAGYRRLGRDEPMPRTLLVVDEFQEMFVEDDKLGQDASLLMDRLVRQGRAFGVHVLLGSQTLGGAYTLARSTMGQMQVRVALQCSEADSYLIMSDDNAAARLLGRPGEAIYNDAGGAIQGNSPFQIVWLSDEERDAQLDRARAAAATRSYEREQPLIVFEGNAAADIGNNHLLEHVATASAAPASTAPPCAWLGEAIAIKDPTNAAFRRQSGSNLLIVGQQDESALSLCASSLISLTAQAARRTPGSENGARYFLLDGSPADAHHAGYLERLGAALPGDMNPVKWRAVEPAMAELAAELKQRQEQDATDAPPIFIIIYGLQRFRMLRTSDDLGFSFDADEKPPAPDRQFAEILRDGTPYGIHTIAWCDTATNLNRTLDRNGLREFEMRVMFQMSGADSTQLIDSPAAGKLGLRRALYYNEEEGVLEKFRPYALPDLEWVTAFAKQLTAR